MEKRSSFRTTSLLYLVLGLGIVTTLGFFAFFNLTGIVDTVSEAGRPDLSLAKVKEIQSDIFDAENSVYTFSIALDSSYLDPFIAAALSADEKLDALHRRNADDPDKSRLTDSLDILVDQKYLLLKQTLALQSGDRVDEALEKVDNKVKNIRPDGINPVEADLVASSETQLNPGTSPGGAPGTEEASEEEKRNIFKRIFGKNPEKEKEEREKKERKRRRNKGDEEEVEEVLVEEDPDIDSLVLANTQAMKKELRAEISRVNREDDAKVKVMSELQLQLNYENKLVSEKIRSIVGQLEQLEQEAIRGRTQEAEAMALRTNRIIIGFCIAAGILLFLLGFGIFDYLRKNNRYQRALMNANQAANDLASTRQRFLANMSHELRTPLNAIAGFTEQVLNSPLPSQQKEQLQVVQQSSDHLLGILNSILDFSRLQSAKLKLEKTTFDPQQTLGLVHKLMRLEAEKKQLQFVFQLEGKLPPAIVGDELRLRQILFNLLNNSIKFTNRGEVGLRVRVHPQNSQQLQIAFRVHDTGIGIPKDKQDSIFQPFEQADVSTSRRYGGTGLGLAITHSLVELHGGSIELESAPEKGTTISFALSYAIGKVKDLPQPSEQKIPVHASLGDKTILVVDDEPYNLLLVKALLSKWKLSMVEATTGKEALEKLEKQRFDAVLMDLRLPDINGLKVTQNARKKSALNAKTPFIALSAATGKDVEAQVKAVGMVAQLPKPFAEAELYKVLENIFGHIPKKAKPSGQKERPASNALSMAPLQKVAQGNPAFLQEMTRTFIESTRKNLAEMKAAGDDWENTGLLAHRMAGPSKHVGAKDLYRLLKSLEKEADNGKNAAKKEELIQQIGAEAERVTTFFEEELSKMV